MKSEKINAKLIFDAQIVEMWLESELDEIFEDKNDDDFWVEKLWFDWYDESIELRFTKLFQITSEQFDKFATLLIDNGFKHGWINFPDKNDELHFSFSDGKRHLTRKVIDSEGNRSYPKYF